MTVCESRKRRDRRDPARLRRQGRRGELPVIPRGVAAQHMRTFDGRLGDVVGHPAGEVGKTVEGRIRRVKGGQHGGVVGDLAGRESAQIGVDLQLLSWLTSQGQLSTIRKASSSASALIFMFPSSCRLFCLARRRAARRSRHCALVYRPPPASLRASARSQARGCTGPITNDEERK